MRIFFEKIKRFKRSLHNTQDQQKTNEVFQDDVFLCSYPRSGNTWLRYLFSFYRNASVEWNLETIERMTPDLHKTSHLLNIPRPRIIKSHYLYQPHYPKVIYLVRDARDVCVSYYDFNKKINGYSGTFSDFISDLCTEKIWPSSWHKHVESWLTNEDLHNMHIIKYEDLLANPLEVFLAALEFSGLKISSSRAEIAIEKASLKRIWGDHQKIGPHRHLGFRGGVAGKAGKWHEYFTKDDETYFYNFASKSMRLCGYV